MLGGEVALVHPTGYAWAWFDPSYLGLSAGITTTDRAWCVAMRAEVHIGPLRVGVFVLLHEDPVEPLDAYGEIARQANAPRDE